MAETPKPKVAQRAIEVGAGKTSKGPPATNIRVQADVQTLDEEVGQGTRTSSAFAFVPRTVDGKRAWSKEDIHRLGKRLNEDERL